MYGLPKIHKPDVPLRPIVSTIGSATYSLAKHLSKIISPLVGQTTSYVKNSAHFSELINQQQVRNNELMVSSLFTNVPVEEALDIVKDRLEADHSIHDRINLSITFLIDLLNMCLKSTYFLYNNKFYQQSQGAAMGLLSLQSLPTFLWNF